MASILYTTAQTENDLAGIIQLQQQNLPAAITPEEATDQGFVTVVHDLEILTKMNDLEQHIIAKDKNQVVAYLLAMTTSSKHDLPVLIPMFEAFDRIFYRGKLVADYRYLVVGQVCVSKAYRGQGVLDLCYDCYRDTYQSKYDFAITEIATRNTRSLQAHRRIGFVEIDRYRSPVGEEWSIVIWDWRGI